MTEVTCLLICLAGCSGNLDTAPETSAASDATSKTGRGRINAGNKNKRLYRGYSHRRDEELSKQGYNAFALIYRPGAQTACEDLARAISFVFENAEELEVDTDSYSLWGGSAGARMAAWLGSYGPADFGGAELPQPGAVIMQYTGHSDYTEYDPPTFACVGENDGIANWRTME